MYKQLSTPLDLALLTAMGAAAAPHNNTAAAADELRLLICAAPAAGLGDFATK